MNEIDWGIKYVNDHYRSRKATSMNEYIVTITPRGETEPVVGCVVSSNYDPRSAWGRYRFFGQMSQDAGQVTVWMGSHGQRETVAGTDVSNVRGPGDRVAYASGDGVMNAPDNIA